MCWVCDSYDGLGVWWLRWVGCVVVTMGWECVVVTMGCVCGGYDGLGVCGGHDGLGVWWLRWVGSVWLRLDIEGMSYGDRIGGGGWYGLEDDEEIAWREGGGGKL